MLYVDQAKLSDNNRDYLPIIGFVFVIRGRQDLYEICDRRLNSTG